MWVLATADCKGTVWVSQISTLDAFFAFAEFTIYLLQPSLYFPICSFIRRCLTFILMPYTTLLHFKQQGLVGRNQSIWLIMSAKYHWVSTQDVLCCTISISLLPLPSLPTTKNRSKRWFGGDWDIVWYMICCLFNFGIVSLPYQNIFIILWVSVFLLFSHIYLAYPGSFT